MLETTRQNVQQVETGKQKPLYKLLVRYEKVFGLPHHELFAVVDDDTSNSVK